jgi:hypothetical protein
LSETESLDVLLLEAKEENILHSKSENKNCAYIEIFQIFFEGKNNPIADVE